MNVFFNSHLVIFPVLSTNFQSSHFFIIGLTCHLTSYWSYTFIGSLNKLEVFSKKYLTNFNHWQNATIHTLKDYFLSDHDHCIYNSTRYLKSSMSSMLGGKPRITLIPKNGRTTQIVSKYVTKYSTVQQTRFTSKYKNLLPTSIAIIRRISFKNDTRVIIWTSRRRATLYFWRPWYALTSGLYTYIS